ncbi:MAG: hypothetical protein LUB59_02515 [Candidatus Gastranaerophilales bacterium]|nr:hypothetical protein [Candidatus Gastranaerophilales bacterium]
MVKIERSFPAPASLKVESQKKSGSYSKPDVIEQLKRDFHNKCYICELKYLQDPEVEHLLPHKNEMYPERKFDWNNLFWSCGHCNSVKNQEKYDDGIIDCCKEDPEEKIFFCLESDNVKVVAQNEQDEKAVLTANLVQEVFNKKNSGMRVYKSDMRLQELRREMNILYDNLEEMKKEPTSKCVRRKLKAMLRRESRFAAFKRNYVRENAEQFSGILSYIQ